MLTRGVARSIALSAALAAVYVLVARLGLLMDAVSGFATLVWPATGLSLAAILLLGYRVWPGIALGALVTNLWVGAPVGVALGIALGNTLEAVGAAYALYQLNWFGSSLRRVRDVIAFIGIAATASTMVSASVGVTSLVVGGLVARGGTLATWRAWWLGDLMGDLVVAPLLLTWLPHPEEPREAASPRRRRLVEGAGLGILLVATSLLFARRGSEAREAYLVFPFLIWAGLRFGAGGAAVATFAVSVVVIAATALGGGPFQTGHLSESLLHLQAFMAVVASTTLILGSASEERRQALELQEVLISLASHELRTPLTSLQLGSEMLARRAQSEDLSREPLAKDVARVQRLVKRLSELVDDLLDISRILSGQFRLDLETVDLQQLVRDIVGGCPESQRDLVRVISDAQPLVGRWDRMRVHHVVSNLVSNALKYGEGRPVEIVLDRVTGRARLVVRDHGVGMAPPDLARILERFERAAARHVGGFGLRLWIAHRVVDALGGTIAVESRLGAGSTFTVELPFEPRSDGER